MRHCRRRIHRPVRTAPHIRCPLRTLGECYRVGELAIDFRETFGQDVVMSGLRVFRSLRPPFVHRVKVGPSAAKIPLDALLTLTGFAATLGTLELTVNQATGVASGSFSATVQGVSEPFGLAVLGVGILGLAAVRRRV